MPCGTKTLHVKFYIFLKKILHENFTRHLIARYLITPAHMSATISCHQCSVTPHPPSIQDMARAPGGEGSQPEVARGRARDPPEGGTRVFILLHLMPSVTIGPLRPTQRGSKASITFRPPGNVDTKTSRYIFHVSTVIFVKI